MRLSEMADARSQKPQHFACDVSTIFCDIPPMIPPSALSRRCRGRIAASPISHKASICRGRRPCPDPRHRYCSELHRQAVSVACRTVPEPPRARASPPSRHGTTFCDMPAATIRPSAFLRRCRGRIAASPMSHKALNLSGAASVPCTAPPMLIRTSPTKRFPWARRPVQKPPGHGRRRHPANAWPSAT